MIGSKTIQVPLHRKLEHPTTLQLHVQAKQWLKTIVWIIYAQ